MKKLNIDDLILFENEDILAFNKPSGLATLEDRNAEINVLSMLKEKYPDIKNCHRLDKYTSGVLLFAKNPETYRFISIQFQNREVKKVYHAVVRGAADFDPLEINAPLLIKPSGPVTCDFRHGKESLTIFHTLNQYKTCALVDCRPITGRKHQIRVHLKYAGHPIVADDAYGGDPIFLSQIKRKYNPSQTEERPIIGRMALHAYSIGFKRINGDYLTIEAPYPKDFRLLISQLEKYDSF